MIIILSKIDIENQIGKGIFIVPFKRNNIKENSINFTLSKLAWTIKPKDSGDGFNRAEPACNNGVITLKPKSTTVVYTEEVVALNNRYGGTFHAKVGIVSKGVVFCSTMIGPSYCGHLMISLQNSTNKEIKMKVGDTFISLVLHKLDHAISKIHTNSNTGGHTEKLNRLGIHTSDDEDRYLGEDWKKNISTISEKLKQETDYNSLKEELKKKHMIYNGVLLVVALIVLVLLYISFRYFLIHEKLSSILLSLGITFLLGTIEHVEGKLKGLFKI